MNINDLTQFFTVPNEVKVYSAKFCNDFKYLLIGTHEGHVLLYDPLLYSLIFSKNVSQKRLIPVGFYEAESVILSYSESWIYKTYTIHNKNNKNYSSWRKITDLVISNDFQYIFFSQDTVSMITILKFIDFTSYKVINPHNKPVDSLKITNDDKFLFSLNRKETVIKMWNIDNNSLYSEFSNDSIVQSFCINDSNELISVSISRVFIWDFINKQLKSCFDLRKEKNIKTVESNHLYIFLITFCNGAENCLYILNKRTGNYETGNKFFKVFGEFCIVNVLRNYFVTINKNRFYTFTNLDWVGVTRKFRLFMSFKKKIRFKR